AVPDEQQFRQLAEDIIAGQKSTAPHPAKVRPLYQRRTTLIWWSAAAAVAIVFLLTFISPSSSPENDVLLGLNDIPKTELRDYIVENIDDFELDELTEIVETNAIDGFRSSLVTIEADPPEEALLDGLSKKDIEAYFEAEGIDEDELEEELFI